MSVTTAEVINEVARERERQQDEEGWTHEHDDKHGGGVLAEAAACYAMTHRSREVPLLWPWERSWWRPKDRRRDLVRAAALIVAEIERLDRGGYVLPNPKASINDVLG